MANSKDHDELFRIYHDFFILRSGLIDMYGLKFLRSALRWCSLRCVQCIAQEKFLKHNLHSIIRWRGIIHQSSWKFRFSDRLLVEKFLKGRGIIRFAVYSFQWWNSSYCSPKHALKLFFSLGIVPVGEYLSAKSYSIMDVPGTLLHVKYEAQRYETLKGMGNEALLSRGE